MIDCSNLFLLFPGTRCAPCELPHHVPDHSALLLEIASSLPLLAMTRGNAPRNDIYVFFMIEAILQVNFRHWQAYLMMARPRNVKSTSIVYCPISFMVSSWTR